MRHELKRDEEETIRCLFLPVYSTLSQLKRLLEKLRLRHERMLSRSDECGRLVIYQHAR